MSGRPRVLRSYYLYQATASCVFFSPVFYVYYQERVGLELATVLWVQSYYLTVRALLDLPLGALADRYSRPACLAAFALCHMAGSATLLLAPTFAGVLAAETLFAVGGAFRSGADSAFLFDALQAADRLDLYPQAESRAQAVISIATGTTAVIGGFLAALDLRLPYVATFLAAAASGTFVLAFGEPSHAHGSRATSVTVLVREAVRHAVGSSAVRWVMALGAFAVVSSHVYFYLQQPYLRGIGVPLALFGVVFAGTKVVTAVIASGAHRIDAALGPRAATAVMAAAPAVGLGAMSLVSVPAGAALILTRGVLDGLWQPLMNVYMNRLVESRLRATMLSAQSLVARLALAGAIALLGVGTARAGLPATLASAALAAAAAGLALVATGPRAPGGPRPCRGTVV
ncbi:MAG TPA: MFS transporter [Candidatus Binatus sp.]|nr:MFS transporter [Candidatus Binatus sp.]